MKEKIKPLSVQACTKKNKKEKKTLQLGKKIYAGNYYYIVLSHRSTLFDGHRCPKFCNIKHDKVIN